MISILVVILTALFSHSTASAYDFEVDGLGYTVVSHTDFTCKLSACLNSYLNKYEIPETVTYRGKELKVIDISSNVFEDKNNLKTVSIPNLPEITGEGIFKGCSRLSTVLFHPDCKIDKIPAEMFSGCIILSSIDLPSTISSIGSGAFSGCTSLTSIDLPSTLSTIGDEAFKDCGSLTSCNLSRVRYVGNRAFESTGLKEIYLSDESCTIGKFAFRYSHDLVNVFIPNSCDLHLSHDGVFMDCTGLQDISLPENSTYIVSNDTSDDDPRFGIFEGCTGLKNFVCPNSINIMPAKMFEGCSALTSIKLSDNLKSINTYAFKGCSSLQAICLPKSVTDISYGVFSDCKEIKELTLSKRLSLPLYRYYSYKNQHNGNIEYAYDGYNLRDCPIEKLTIPAGDSITFYKYVMFGDKNGLQRLSSKEVNDAFPSSISHLSIDNPNLFGGSTEWKKTYHAGSHQYIYTGEVIENYENVTLSFPNLIRLDLGSNMDNLNCLDWNFPNLQILKCVAGTPPPLPSLDNICYMNWTVIVPQDCLDAYKNAPGWCNFWDLQGDPNVSGVEELHVSCETPVVLIRTNLNGIHVDETYKGMVIVRYSDGSTCKILQ